MTITIYNGRSAPELATSADDAVRGINHLTRDHGSVRYPGEACRVLGSLASLADRLPQAFEQIARLLERWYQAGHLRIDGGQFHDDPAEAISAASRHLHDEALPAAEHLAQALADAQSAIAWASYTGASPDTAE